MIILRLTFYHRRFADVCHEGKVFFCDWLPDYNTLLTSTPDMLFQMYFDNLERFKYRLPNDEELRSIDIRRRRIEQAGGGGINRFEDWFLQSAAPERIRCYHEGSAEYNLLTEKLARDLL